ncbi:MAG: serine/threonine protein kinase [Planctomycetes bacterium]|nr:serine/threonine protein kinase [Planctomycetota bacterium]
MTTADERARHATVAEWFTRLCDLPREQQEAELASADLAADVADELRALLGLDRSAPAALDADRLGVSGPALDAALADEPLPASIGSYRIVRLLGRGGMGSVYEAEQPHPRRRVALKVVNAIVATPAVLRRFQHEAHVLGLLQHPGIAQIIEAGTFDHGRGVQPFFAMEYVEGRPLDEYATAQRLDVRARLDLFARVCDAVHHAHQRGVVHRDLKPANVLVTADGAPKVLDFGVARVTQAERQETMMTAVGQIIGTLGYMSPEQARGDVDLDTSSDVYSLGVVLYALLAGRMPYDTTGKTLHDAIRTVIEMDPVSISTVAPALRGDVATIVHKALEKTKERRYESGAALGADVRRFLNHEPIAARPPTAMYHLRKFAQRNRALVVGACGLVLTLIASTVIAITLTIQKERERAEADAVAQFLSDLFVAAMPKDRDPSSLTALELLDAGVERLDRYTSGEPVRRAVLLEALGKTYRELSVHDRAEALLREALAIRREHLGDAHVDTLETMSSIGVLCRKVGRYDEAIELGEKVLAGRRAAFGDHDESVAQAMNNLSVALQAVGRSDEALTLLGEASAITVALRGRGDAGAITQRANYGLQLVVAKRPEAVDAMREVYSGARSALGDKNIATLHAGYVLGVAYLKSDRHQEAIDTLEPVLIDDREVYGARSIDTASTAYTLGEAHRLAGHAQRAFELLDEAHSIGVEVLGADHDWVLSALLKSAQAAAALGRVDEARTRAEDVLRRAEASEGAQRAKIAPARELLDTLDGKASANK